MERGFGPFLFLAPPNLPKGEASKSFSFGEGFRMRIVLA